LDCGEAEDVHYGDQSGNEAVPTKRGSYEMRGDGVNMQIGAARAV
jgi:hypothetical protein